MGTFCRYFLIYVLVFFHLNKITLESLINTQHWSGYDLSNGQQLVRWANDDQFHWEIYASLNLNESIPFRDLKCCTWRHIASMLPQSYITVICIHGTNRYTDGNKRRRMMLYAYLTITQKSEQKGQHLADGSLKHNSDVTMGAMASQITSLAIIY